MSRALTVLDTGAQALVQDLGRPGYAHLGVPPSGALDAPALRLANRLVGNPESAAGLEVLLGGLRLRSECSCTVAVTGPRVRLTVDGHLADSHVPVHLKPAQTLALDVPVDGLRNYLAVRGGIDVPAELGSGSTDVLSGLGPEPLRAGQVLALGTASGLPAGADALAPARMPERLRVEVLLGPRDDWFDDPAGQLASRSWTVTPDSNRIGLRLQGTPLRPAEAYRAAQLPSEPVLTGAVQVPANGQPVIFLADHPTTGGYPVIGVVAPDALPELAQARPGSTVHLHPVH